MSCRRHAFFILLLYFLSLYAAVALGSCTFQAKASAQDSTSSSNRSRSHTTQKPRPAESLVDTGLVSAGVYRNPAFGFTCKVPAGWVLRTEEMNAQHDEGANGASAQAATNSGKAGRVLLAAFSRPPEARAEDVNGSILIAAESAASYAGLKDPAQYFGPVTEVAKAQGFEIDGEPYGFVLGTKTLVRGDFEKNVGTRVMRQSTLVMLARGYVVSFTFIGGTENELEELVQGLSFGSAKPAR
jgi:hypothetical protein